MPFKNPIVARTGLACFERYTILAGPVEPLRVTPPEAEVLFHNNDEIVRFIFWGGVLRQDQIGAIELQAEELSEFGFFDIADAQALTSPALGRQLAEILDALEGDRTVYTEHLIDEQT